MRILDFSRVACERSSTRESEEKKDFLLHGRSSATQGGGERQEEDSNEGSLIALSVSVVCFLVLDLSTRRPRLVGFLSVCITELSPLVLDELFDRT